MLISCSNFQIEVESVSVPDTEAYEYDNSYEEDDYQYEDPFDATVFM